jgi:hypothetical protein
MARGDTNNGDRRGHRGRKRAPVIDGTATEVMPPETPVDTVSDAAAALAPDPAVAMAEAVVTSAEPGHAEGVDPAVHGTPEPPVPEAAEPAAGPAPDLIAPPAPPPLPPEKPRYGVPMAAAALLGAVFGAGAGAIIPGFLGGPALDPARVLKLEQGVADLAKRPLPAPVAGNGPELQALSQRLAAIDADIRTRLAALDQKVASTPPAAGAPADIAPLTARFGALESAMAALDQKAEAARTAAGEGLRAVEPQLQQLAARLNQTVQRVEITAAAPVYSAAQALNQAFQRGVPFPAEVAALEALGVKPEQLAALKALAARGVPSAQKLADTFQPLAMELARAGQPAASGLGAIWQSLVTSRPTGPGAADTPQGLVAAIESALRVGDVAAALAAWAKLPEPARKASEAWASTAREREAAQKAVKDLQDAALGALRKAAP